MNRFDFDIRDILKDDLIALHYPFVKDVSGNVFRGNIDTFGAGLVKHVGKQLHLELEAENVHLGNVLLAAFEDDLLHKQPCYGRW